MSSEKPLSLPKHRPSPILIVNPQAPPSTSWGGAFAPIVDLPRRAAAKFLEIIPGLFITASKLMPTDLARLGDGNGATHIVSVLRPDNRMQLSVQDRINKGLAEQREIIFAGPTADDAHMLQEAATFLDEALRSPKGKAVVCLVECGTGVGAGAISGLVAVWAYLVLRAGLQDVHARVFIHEQLRERGGFSTPSGSPAQLSEELVRDRWLIFQQEEGIQSRQDD